MVAISLSLSLSVLLSLTQGVSAGYSNAARALEKRYTKPGVGTTWDYPLGTNFRSTDASSNVYFYSVDLFNTAAADIASLKNSGHYVACYYSAGTWEGWRPDASGFPPSTKKNNVDGWNDEKWVVTSNMQLRTEIMAKRIKLAKQKGCQAIDPDNIDGYSPDNNSGTGLTKADGIDYVKWTCNQAHSLDMACGLKNGVDIVPNVITATDFSIVEQCVEYNECRAYSPFIAAGKAVYHVEYTEDEPPSDAWKNSACASGGESSFSTIIKHVELDRWRLAC